MNRIFQAAFIFLALSGIVRAESKEQTETEMLSEQSKVQLENAANPVQMVRTLQLMQDQIAIGSIEAHMGQRGLLTILDSRFMNLDSKIWTDDKNVRAAIAFVLSGGSPQILRKLLEMSNPLLSKENREFVEGALAYVEGREEEAKRKLSSIDANSLPPMIAAQLALAQSALIVRADANKSSDLLDYVRLQAPGTLLEEAALRRQVFVASQIGDTKKFLALSSMYLRRYRHSIYAGNFRQRLASALTRVDLGKDPAFFDSVVALMMELEPDARRDLYLMAARSSVDRGLTRSARLLAEKALEYSGSDIISATRAKLYRAAALIASPETIDSAIKDLQRLDKSILTESDVTLLEAALSIASRIQEVPGEKVAGFPQNLQNFPTKENVMAKQSAGTAQGLEQLQAVLKARDALNRIDQLIKNQVSTVQ